jgi:hypothetical protein
MDCRFEEIGDKPDARGARRVRCARCGFTLKPTASPLERCIVRCASLPFWHEWGHWLTIALGACGITKSGVNWWRAQLGLRTPCKCGERAEVANSLGERFASLIRLGVTRARKP